MINSNTSMSPSQNDQSRNIPILPLKNSVFNMSKFEDEHQSPQLNYPSVMQRIK